MAAVFLSHAGPDGGPLFTMQDVEAVRRAADGDVDASYLRGLAVRLAEVVP